MSHPHPGATGTTSRCTKQNLQGTRLYSNNNPILENYKFYILAMSHILHLSEYVFHYSYESQTKFHKWPQQNNMNNMGSL